MTGNDARAYWLKVARQRMREQRDEELCDHGVKFLNCRECEQGRPPCKECGGRRVHDWQCTLARKEPEA